MRSWGLTPTGGPQKLRAGDRSRQDDEWPRVLPGSEVSFWPGSRGGYPKTSSSLVVAPASTFWRIQGENTHVVRICELQTF